jgi:ribosomal protein L11 methyltransferase
VRRLRFTVPEPELDPVLDRFIHLLPRGVRVTSEHGMAAVEAIGPALPDLREHGVGDVEADEVPADFQLRRAPGGVVIGRRVLIRSPEDEPREGLLDVVIAWGGAGFGSGSHPTTRMCAELLLDVEPAGLLDVGTGLGTLAIVAAALGFAPVTAVDRDTTALEAAQGNVARNGSAITTQLVDAETDELHYEPVVVVNAPPAVHARVAHGLPAATHTVIASGFTTPEAELVLDAYAAAGLSAAAAGRRVDADGVWNAARLVR